jgi:hypothetical protein
MSKPKTPYQICSGDEHLDIDLILNLEELKTLHRLVVDRYNTDLVGGVVAQAVEDLANRLDGVIRYLEGEHYKAKPHGDA